MKERKDAICSDCGWSGEATGMTECPECGKELVFLDSEKLESSLGEPKEYPHHVMSKLEDDVLSDDY